MTATSRELVYQTLNFTGPARAPRDLRTLPIPAHAHPAELAAILAAFPPDLMGIDGHEREHAPTRGDQYAIGEFTDEWGATVSYTHLDVYKRQLLCAMRLTSTPSWS